MSYTSYIQSLRNSITVFKNLVLPCEGLNLHMLESDGYINGAETSNTIRFDCDSIGYHEGDDIFRLDNSNAGTGEYRLVSFVAYDHA